MIPLTLALLALAASPVALKARWVLTDPASPAISGGTVVVEGDRIVTIGSEIPPGATVMDLGDLTLLPGLIDAHSHLSLDVLAGNEAEQVKASDAELALRAARQAARDLESGVTTRS